MFIIVSLEILLGIGILVCKISDLDILVRPIVLLVTVFFIAVEVIITLGDGVLDVSIAINSFDACWFRRPLEIISVPSNDIGARTYIKHFIMSV